MPRHFSLWIVSPPGYLHSRCFEEVALGLQEAFWALGFDAPIVTDPARIADYAIVLGANLLPSFPAATLPPRLILYNLEQIQKGSVWLKPGYIELLKRYRVWDYSARNIAALRELGVTDVALCGIGYMPALSRIEPAGKDIDVLFIGSLNDRRKAVLADIARHGKSVSAAFNSYGTERDRLIARAKIQLNVHFYEAQVFEIVRVSYLLANRQCVVCETGHDSALETPLHSGIAFAPYSELPARCLALLHDAGERARLAEAGFESFSALSQAEMLKAALGSLPAGEV